MTFPGTGHTSLILGRDWDWGLALLHYATVTVELALLNSAKLCGLRSGSRRCSVLA